MLVQNQNLLFRTPPSIHTLPFLSNRAMPPENNTFFRLGDFYESFDEDAKRCAEACNIVLTAQHGYNAPRFCARRCEFNFSLTLSLDCDSDWTSKHKGTVIPLPSLARRNFSDVKVFVPRPISFIAGVIGRADTPAKSRIATGRERNGIAAHVIP